MGSSSQTYSAVNDGCYWVEATDSAGCTSYDTVCVATSGVEGLHPHDSLIACTGGNVSFDASVNVNASGDSLVITFDATQNPTSAPLLGASEVYFYSAPQFYPFAPWPANDPYTVGHFGANDGLGKMTSVGPNKWEITIFPSCYYSYNPDTPLNAIWMLFTNGNGSAQAPPSGGSINLYVAGMDTATSPYAGVSGYHKSTNNITYSWSPGVNASGAVGTFSASGTYYVTAADGTCSRTDTILVNQSASPTVNLGNDTCVAAGHTVTIDAGAGYASYVWSTGASTETITANLAGTYYVTVSTSAGCTGTDSIIVSRGASVSLGRDTCIYPGGSYLLSAGAGATSYLWTPGGATTDTLRATATGTYSVVVTEGGCTGSDSITINSCNHTIAGCVAVADFKVQNISAANTVTFEDSSYNEYGTTTYYWNYGDTTSYTSAAPGNSVHTYGAAGIYTVTLIVTDSCGSDTLRLSVNVNYTGITEIKGINEVSLYPNPTSNSCTISVDAAQNIQATVEVSNILGATVQVKDWQIVSGSNKLVLDLSGAASGMYTVTIRSQEGVMTKKLDIIK
jgi:PKD repeat protein